MAKKSELENQLADLRVNLEDADSDEIREELQAKITALEADLENAEDEEDLEQVESDLERLQQWAKNEIGAPIAELKTEMAEIRALLEKVSRKIKTNKSSETPPVETPPAETVTPPKPEELEQQETEPKSPPPEKPTRQITRL